jgi:hypothetical protein
MRPWAPSFQTPKWARPSEDSKKGQHSSLA